MLPCIHCCEASHVTVARFFYYSRQLGKCPKRLPRFTRCPPGSILKTHLKFPSKMCELGKLDCINSFSNIPRISKPRLLLPVSIHCSVLICVNFPGEMEISLLSGALTNRLLELCAGKMGLFSAEKVVNLYLSEYFFLEGLFHYRSNKFFSWVNCSSHLTWGTCMSPALAASSHRCWQGKPGLAKVLLKGKE